MGKLIYTIILFGSVISCGMSYAAAKDYVGVDLRDIVRYRSSEFPQAKTILYSLKSHPEKYFGESAGEVDTTFGVELYDIPRKAGEIETIPVVILVHLKSGTFYFRKFEIDFQRGILSQVRPASSDLELKNAHFKVQVGVNQRKVILNDSVNNITIIYPLGLGGIDDITSPGKIKFSTPAMTGAFLEKDNVIAKRTDPAYYKGKPFLAISRPRGHTTGFAFHIEVNNQFSRSFESHGCMRLREKDLMEFFSIVMNSRDSLELEIAIDFPTGGDHPFPLHNASYEHVKNFGTREHPVTKRSATDHLLIMERVNATPPWLKTENGPLPTHDF